MRKHTVVSRSAPANDAVSIDVKVDAGYRSLIISAATAGLVLTKRTGQCHSESRSRKSCAFAPVSTYPEEHRERRTSYGAEIAMSAVRQFRPGKLSREEAARRSRECTQEQLDLLYVQLRHHQHAIRDRNTWRSYFLLVLLCASVALGACLVSSKVID